MEVFFESGQSVMQEDDPYEWECPRCRKWFHEPWLFCDADFNPICDDCFGK